MALTVPAPNDVIRAALYNELTGLLNGTALAGQPVLLTQLSSASAWALTVKNLGAGGQAVRVQSAAGVDVLTVSDSGTALAVSLTADVTMTPPSNSGAVKMKTTSSGAESAVGTSEGPRDALVWLRDTNAASADSCVLKVDYIEDNATASKTRTGIDVSGFTRLDSGSESSCLLLRNTGGGGVLAAYATTRLRPAGYTDYSYTPQGAIEAATSNMSQAALLQSGFPYPETSAAPWPTLTADVLLATAMVGAGTLPISNVLLIPTPGGATPDAGPGGAYPTWPTPLYVRIGVELFSYTGKSVASGAGNLTGVTRAVAGTAAALHVSTTKVEPVNANHALLVRLAEPLSKGITVAATDSLYNTRPAFGVAVPVRGAPADSAYTFLVTMAGAVTATSMSATTINATNLGAVGLTLTGPQYLTGIVNATLTANTDNWNPTGLASARLLRIASTGGPWNLTGIVAQTAGLVLTLRNVSAVNVVLIHNATSTAANQFFFVGAANITLLPQSAVTLTYDGTLTRWVTLGGAG